MEIVKIDGVNYKVISESPVKAQGYNGRTALKLKRIGGKLTYVATRYESGRVSKAFSIGL